MVRGTAMVLLLLAAACGRSSGLYFAADGSGGGTGAGPGEDPVGHRLLNLEERELSAIDPDTQSVSLLCDLPELEGIATRSLAFTRDGRLFAATKPLAIWEVDPCACEARPIIEHRIEGLAGMAADSTSGLLGIASATDEMIRIDVEAGVATPVGSLGVDLGNQGASWSPDETIYVLHGSGSGDIFAADPAGGELSYVSTLDYPFLSVGFEYHPSGRYFACERDGLVYEVDPTSGRVERLEGVDLGFCGNLATPPASVPHCSP